MRLVIPMSPRGCKPWDLVDAERARSCAA
jgi:hypothetical protein